MISRPSLLIVPLALVLATVARSAAAVAPSPVPLAVADRQPAVAPDRVQLSGWIGARVLGNEAVRLRNVDTDRLLEGYRHRPGRQTWDCEHVGKWLHAATLAWANTGDPQLRQKLDATVAALAACQLEDGYLGTYLPKDRWTEWDVWAHKYNLIGLLTYLQYTGETKPLSVCTKMADLLCRSFGDDDGKLNIIHFGHHNGMAATSVLEPMAQLYEITGEKRYLEFCRYILRAWEEPDGPHIISRLLDGKRVDKVGNAKAYEMLSCINGALELYRITGDRALLEAGLNAWQDITEHRLYLTGTASYAEYFHDDFDLPNRGNVAETCVTVTWLQLNARLLALTGEARFAEQLEKTVMNQLFGAQQPDCTAWGYYVEMEGKKPYSATLDANCCLSSGPRGVALIPTFAFGRDADGVVVNLYSQAQADLSLADATRVILRVDTAYPKDGRISVHVDPATETAFAVKLRVPAWADGATAAVNGESIPLSRGGDGYAAVHRTWKRGDVVTLSLPLTPRLIVGDHTNAGKIALAYGPLILAADAQRSSTKEPLARFAIGSTDLATLRVNRGNAAGDELVFRTQALLRSLESPIKEAQPTELAWVPFADAGGTGAEYRVWISQFGAPGYNLALLGTESRSRSVPNNWGHPASLIDGNCDQPVTTRTGAAAEEDWFAVGLPATLPVSRVVFYHGRSESEGGWFDAAKGKPRVQVQREQGGSWTTLGELASYPATTATSDAGLKQGSRFEFRLPAPETVAAVRVIGAPAGGQKPNEAYASCAELEIFGD